MLDRRDRLEKAVILLLKRQPTGYLQAFNNISRNTRLIYVHGYQSYIWNKAVSERLRRYGRQVLVGDLVVKRENADLIEQIIEIGGVEEPVEEEVINPDEEQKDEDQKESRGRNNRPPINPVLDVTEENI